MALRTLGALTLTTALALSACTSDDPEPTFAPEPSASTSTSPAAAPPTPSTDAVPSMPADARSDTEKGAIAFVRHFWDVANYAQATGDGLALAQLVSAQCDGCQGALEAIRDVYSAGGEIEGGQSTATKFRAEKLSTSLGPLLRVTFELSNDRQVVRKPGTKDRVFPARRVTDRFVLRYVDGAWRVDVWEVLA
ncbi:DUF6318 family protein [Nocardioides marmotae]|uniref:DUF6318 family protein n=1 Tax=Nocardioides marmotae TaxID=2663857 RepID=UPI0012B55784|nr:DUF6318 family protein [Nocardioides marmotae]MBC9735518.1 hypothetical protein [Nocardioides marmotae]MTB86615.1 hypothetical protein [Nocardioides marmotae]